MEFNAEKCHVLEMGKSAMKPSWTYMLGQHIISIIKEETGVGWNPSQPRSLQYYLGSFDSGG